LLDENAAIYRDIVPQIVRAVPKAVLIAVTDPDPLADVAREAAGHDRVLSTGIFLDSLCFRAHLGKHFWRRSCACESTGDRRPRHLAGVPMVVCAHRRSLAILLKERGEKLDDLRTAKRTSATPTTSSSRDTRRANTASASCRHGLRKWRFAMSAR